MKGSFGLGSFRGIQIKTDFGLVLILGLFASLLAIMLFPYTNPTWNPPARWVVAAVVTFMLFVAILVHEMAHALVSNILGLRVEKISLFIFGGKTQVEGFPDRAVTDLLMALAGPAINLFLFLALILLAKILGWLHVPESVIMALNYGAYVNIILVLFNMVPIFPLDGGRVLRALIWRFNGNCQSATKIAAMTGDICGYIMILGGLYLIPAGEYLIAVWLVFNGWYVHRLSQSGFKGDQDAGFAEGLKPD